MVSYVIFLGLSPRMWLPGQDPYREAEERAEEDKVALTFKLAAQYIAMSFALQVINRCLSIFVLRLDGRRDSARTGG